MGWSAAENLQQHKGWRTHSDAHQATEHPFTDLLIKEATTKRVAATQALQRQLSKQAVHPMKAAALLQLEAVRRAEAQMAHRKRLMLTHTERLTDSTAREHMLRLIHYHAVTKRFTNLLNAPHTAPTSVHRPPRHHWCAPEERQPQHPAARGT